MSGYKTNVEIQTFIDGNVKLLFHSNCGKHGTDEILDEFNLTAEQLLNILQANEASTSHEKALDIDLVSVSLEGTANKLIEMYEERETTASKNGNWSEAFQNEIRVNVLQHLILLHKHNER